MNRNKSRSISLIEVDLSNPSKHYDVNNEDAISEHKSEYISFSQSQKYRKLKREDIWFWGRREMLEVDSDKSCTSNSDIHSESDIEQWLEEDNEEITQITDVTWFNESEKLSIIKSF